jgi:hypothetical protein
MSFILTLNLIFGIMFVIRMSMLSTTDPLITCKSLTKIGTALICSQIFVAFMLFNHQIVAIVCIHIASFAAFATISTLRWRSKRALNEEYFNFIQDLVMNLKLGAAFRKASSDALESRSTLFRTVMQNLLRAQSIYIGHSRRHMFLTVRALEELRNAEQFPHTALKRLCALREEQTVLSDFRRRSGHATAQARIQSIILWVLLFALGFGVAIQFGWQRCYGHFAAALGLFVCGQLVFNRVIRKTKWNV